MYFAVSKIGLDLDTETSRDEKALKSLCEKIRARFKVAAASVSTHKGETAIVIAALAQTEERLSGLLDDVSALCEESGIGRVVDEQTLLDHIDAIDGLEDDES